MCSASEFVKVSQNYTPKSFTISLDSRRAYRMEGYLFPDTYEFYVDDDPENVLIRLLNNYNAKAGGISDKQLIVASIVEKESRSAENAAMVASVIYNRLNAGMKLEMDATREYVNQSITGSPYLGSTGSYAALYNTYKCSALPVGPICCPGSRAIQAAVSLLPVNITISSLETTTRTTTPRPMRSMWRPWRNTASSMDKPDAL